MSATPDYRDSLVFECDFEEPPEKVWRALTEPRLLEMWLAGEEASRIGPDEEPHALDGPRRVAQRARHADEADSSLRRVEASEYRIVAAEPHRLLRYSWLDREGGVGGSGGGGVRSTVTIELIPGPTGGTHLRLTHGDFRFMAAAPIATAARPRPITGARRRPRILSLAGHIPWKRAA